MHKSVQNLNIIKNKANEIINRTQQKTNTEVIAISKTFKADKILPLLEAGHLHFGENKIQEAEEKWVDLKKKYTNIKLHLVGKLQSNKAKKAVMLFDYIHSLDNIKLATKINQYEKQLNKKTKIFIQVNVANENQKSGVLLNELDSFYNYCKKNLALNIIGLMVLPPLDDDPSKYFKILRDKSIELNLKDLSMGMSSDYEKALSFNSTFIRLGTAIFGNRNV
tara:strand:+ start:1648 stop:2313 length:666 start_codon:yes stop_codon:yes gene_type:complete